MGVLGIEPPVPGKSLKLTIDLDVQEAAEKAIGNRAGAMVAIDPRTGEVLAMVSRPSFDPNLFAGRVYRRPVAPAGSLTPTVPSSMKPIQAQLDPVPSSKSSWPSPDCRRRIAQT